MRLPEENFERQEQLEEGPEFIAQIEDPDYDPIPVAIENENEPAFNRDLNPADEPMIPIEIVNDENEPAFNRDPNSDDAEMIPIVISDDENEPAVNRDPNPADELMIPIEIVDEDEPVLNLAPKCVVCLENIVTHGFVPCGHACSCLKCATILGQKMIKKCPKCRAEFTQFIAIFNETP
ncbi:uncharacterized protein [Venturia canescens]|uniref:uncharacterized protein n=1 Tax=Venturia canescens TaxID=32260 RepID=UPI001C9C6B7B|nr:uncharacterized protein LOC122408310 [Venturia canescens]